ncbi:MAG: LysR family transcriptional regulator [Yoonia sp.]
MNIKKFKSWGQLQTVLTVAEVGSYRAAAHILGVTSSTVARHVDTISQELGHPIFLPAGNRWELTEIGKELVAIAEATQSSLGFMLKDIENSDDFFGALQINTLSFINSDFLAPAMNLWREKFPQAQIVIEANDETTAIERGEADVALRLSRPDTPSVARFKVANCKVALYTPEGGDEDAWVGLPQSLEDLPEMQLARQHFGTFPIIRMDSYRAIANASQASGLSCAIPTCMARAYPDLRRVSLDDVQTHVDRELWFLFYETRKNDPAIKAAKCWIKDVFPSPNKCLCDKCD